jgi:hypothetical protein
MKKPASEPDRVFDIDLAPFELGGENLLAEVCIKVAAR